MTAAVSLESLIDGISRVWQLKLPNLNEIRLENVLSAKSITLDAPKLSKIYIWDFLNRVLPLKIIHLESVKTVVVHKKRCLEVEKFVNLEYLYVVNSYQDEREPYSAKLLSNLKFLKEVHFEERQAISFIYSQMQRYERFDLKVYYRGLLLKGQDDEFLSLHPVYAPWHLNEEIINFMLAKRSRLADEILFYESFEYPKSQQWTEKVQVDHQFWHRFTKMNRLEVSLPIQNTECCLDFLKNFHMVVFNLSPTIEPDEYLFNRLSDYSPSIQYLTINGCSPHSRDFNLDLSFLFKLKNLIELDLRKISIETIFVKKIFEKLEFLKKISFSLRVEFVVNRRHSTMLKTGLDDFFVKKSVFQKKSSFTIFPVKSWPDDLNDVIEILNKRRAAKKQIIYSRENCLYAAGVKFLISTSIKYGP